MIKLVNGDILSSETEAIVNTVNCVGVMGKGIALQFKKAYPDNFKAYKKACDQGKVTTGEMMIFDKNSLLSPKYIINFPTKQHWRSPSKMEYITTGLRSLADVIRRLNIKSIAIPPLGCGYGGLSWSDVLPAIKKGLAGLGDVEIIIYQPTGTPDAKKMKIRTSKPKMTIFRADLISLIDEYLIYDYPLTRLEIQKLSYFLQNASNRFNIRDFAKGKYGPYSNALEHAMQALDGHWLIGCGDNADPRSKISLISEATEYANKFLETTQEECRQDRERVFCLIDGFQTPFGMELLASVHWVAIQEEADSLEKVIQQIRTWTPRKEKIFPSEYIKIAWEQLTKCNWI